MLALLFALACARPLPSQDAVAPPEPDTRRSDPAAIGFLKGYVDERMLSLPAQGAQRLEGVARVVLRSDVGARQELRFELSQDYESGTATITPPAATAVDPQWQTTASQAVASFLDLMGPLSLYASSYLLTLEREGDQVRIDGTPRADPTRKVTFWFAADGTLLRRRLSLPSPGGTAVSVSVFEVREEQGRALLVAEEQTLSGQRVEHRYDYGTRGGYRMLERAHVEGVMYFDPELQRWQRLPVTLDVEFEVAVSPAR